MPYRILLAAVAVTLKSTAVSAPAAGQGAEAPTIIPAETLKWKPTPFADVIAALV